MYRQDVNYNAIRRNFIEFQKPVNKSLSLNQQIRLQQQRLNFLTDFSSMLGLNTATKRRVLSKARQSLDALVKARHNDLSRRLMRPPKTTPRVAAPWPPKTTPRVAAPRPFTPTTVATLVGNNTPRRSTPSPKKSKKKTVKTYLNKMYRWLQGK